MAFVPGGYEPPSGARVEAEARLHEEQPHRRPGLGGSSAFAVSAAFPGRGVRSRGKGELVISSNSIVFYPSALTTRLTGAGEFTHAGREITLTIAHLRPPWANTLVLLQKGPAYVRVGASVFARRKLRRALSESSGVTVREERGWQAPPLPPGPVTLLGG